MYIAYSKRLGLCSLKMRVRVRRAASLCKMPEVRSVSHPPIQHPVITGSVLGTDLYMNVYCIWFRIYMGSARKRLSIFLDWNNFIPTNVVMEEGWREGGRAIVSY